MKVFRIDGDPPHYALVQWTSPIEVPAREHPTFGRGAPFLRLLASPEHVEVRYAWSFSSGHMEIYEEETMRRVERHEFDEAFFGELGSLFSPESAAEVQGLYESTGPYGLSG